ncbi:site-specific integrase [Stenotrophomonas maltophilia]|uniref:site-specific integrase n=1 Tax=Stenotrophomonas maltophilia TaxID=40324 RepID=UPI000C14EC1F|nr:site-specific integrase [Stenotrophomonas maltophilia]
MSASKKTKETPRPKEAVSKAGYAFNVLDEYWQLDKDVTVALGLVAMLPDAVQSGFRLTLQRYAEELSAHHTYNMAEAFKRYLRDTGAKCVTPKDLLNWRASLGADGEWRLGALKGFLLAWHEFGFNGVSEETAELLRGWTIKGNEKGAAVATGCPETGPYTDLEMAALLDWANSAVIKRKITFKDFVYLLALAMTARRTVQLAALRGRDLKGNPKEVASLYLNVPRAKQRNLRFRGKFRSIPIIEDLFLVLDSLHRRAVADVEATIGAKLDDDLRKEVPIFINEDAAAKVKSVAELRDLLAGSKPDALHATTSSLDSALLRYARANTARSERTGEFIRLSARRFRHTRGTKLRREGFGAFVIAELLDHSDIQNVRVYTENTANEVAIIDEFIGPKLAPFAQACLGRLVRLERDAIRGDDPRSRVANDRSNGVGTCGNYGFCASGYRACYTCTHFQPWVHGPHQEVLEDLYAEKSRARDAGCSDVVVSANDLLILAVEHCITLCSEFKDKLAIPDSDEEMACV